eukprot:3702566-Rhodomonas_salina.1
MEGRKSWRCSYRPEDEGEEELEVERVHLRPVHQAVRCHLPVMSRKLLWSRPRLTKSTSKLAGPGEGGRGWGEKKEEEGEEEGEEEVEGDGERGGEERRRKERWWRVRKGEEG